MHEKDKQNIWHNVLCHTRHWQAPYAKAWHNSAVAVHSRACLLWHVAIKNKKLYFLHWNHEWNFRIFFKYSFQIFIYYWHWIVEHANIYITYILLWHKKRVSVYLRVLHFRAVTFTWARLSLTFLYFLMKIQQHVMWYVNIAHTHTHAHTCLHLCMFALPSVRNKCCCCCCFRCLCSSSS